MSWVYVYDAPVVLLDGADGAQAATALRVPGSAKAQDFYDKLIASRPSNVVDCHTFLMTFSLEPWKKDLVAVFVFNIPSGGEEIHLQSPLGFVTLDTTSPLLLPPTATNAFTAILHELAVIPKLSDLGDDFLFHIELKSECGPLLPTLAGVLLGYPWVYVTVDGLGQLDRGCDIVSADARLKRGSLLGSEVTVTGLYSNAPSSSTPVKAASIPSALLDQAEELAPNWAEQWCGALNVWRASIGHSPSAELTIRQHSGPDGSKVVI